MINREASQHYRVGVTYHTSTKRGLYVSPGGQISRLRKSIATTHAIAVSRNGSAPKHCVHTGISTNIRSGRAKKYLTTLLPRSHDCCWKLARCEGKITYINSPIQKPMATRTMVRGKILPVPTAGDRRWCPSQIDLTAYRKMHTVSGDPAVASARIAWMRVSWCRINVHAQVNKSAYMLSSCVQKVSLRSSGL